MKTNKIIEIGPFPPPFGGVSVHVSRLCDLLEKSGFEVRRIGRGKPTSSFSITIESHPFRSVWAIMFGDHVVHFHGHERDWKMIILISLLLRCASKDLVISLHSFRQERFIRFTIPRRMFAWSLRSARRVICVSETLQSEAARLLETDIGNTRIVSSFLPPTSEEIHAELDSRINRFLNSHANTFVFNSSDVRLHGGRDLYGVMTVLRAFERLSELGVDAFCIMCFSNSCGGDYGTELRRKAESLKGRVLWMEEYEGSFPAIVARSAGSIRATIDDGGPSITVMEAKSLGVPAIASDAVPRGDGVVLFKTDSDEDLAEKITEVVSMKYNRSDQVPVSVGNSEIEILALFAEVFEEKSARAEQKGIRSLCNSFF